MTRGHGAVGGMVGGHGLGGVSGQVGHEGQGGHFVTGGHDTDVVEGHGLFG